MAHETLSRDDDLAPTATFDRVSTEQGASHDSNLR